MILFYLNKDKLKKILPINFYDFDKYNYKKNSDNYISFKYLENFLNKRYFFDLNYGFINNNINNFYNMIKLVKKFFLQFNIYPLKTTIEGALINRDNYSFIYAYIIKNDFYDNKTKNNIISLFNKFDDMNISNYNKTHQKLSVLRFLHHGKRDDLAKDFIFNVNDSKLDYPKYNNKPNNNYKRYDKTSGWVTSLLNSYQTINNIKYNFKNDFKELNSVFTILFNKFQQ